MTRSVSVVPPPCGYGFADDQARASRVDRVRGVPVRYREELVGPDAVGSSPPVEPCVLPVHSGCERLIQINPAAAR